MTSEEIIKLIAEKKEEQVLKENQQVFYGVIHLLIDKEPNFHIVYINGEKLPSTLVCSPIYVKKRGSYSIQLALEDLEKIPEEHQKLIETFGVKVFIENQYIRKVFYSTEYPLILKKVRNLSKIKNCSPLIFLDNDTSIVFRGICPGAVGGLENEDIKQGEFMYLFRIKLALSKTENLNFPQL